MDTIDTIIIGGGLSGMYAAHLLYKKNIPFIVLEAQNRIGGRILSIDYQGFSTDLGPSWYWPEINPRILKLVKSAGLKSYRQFEEGMGRFEYPNGIVRTVRAYKTAPSSWRITGGMQALITKLAQTFPGHTIKLNSAVCEIEKKSDCILINIGEPGEKPLMQYCTRRVILAIPPRLCASTILFTPDLPSQLTQAMLKTGTWMAGQAKFYALYEKPDWRIPGLSGQAFSQRGPLGEIHDASNNGTGPYGLTGFLNIPAAQRHCRQAVVDAILSQLGSIYGKQAATPLTFYYKDWAREKFTATEFDWHPMHEHPVYQPPAGKTSIWDNTIHFAGSETSDQYGGYLEGALASAQRAVNNLVQQ